MASAEISILLGMIDQAWDGESWHGQNLRGSVRRVNATEASWRPAPRRHNIHELVVHAAYWKYAALRRLTGAEKGSFAYKGSNWFARREADDALWKRDVALLVASHEALRAAVEALDPRDLARITPGAKSTNQVLLTGIAAHDLYHAGQIQLIKKLRPRSRLAKRRDGA
jgi:uncharacterized damage-inducible protein DinB